MPACANVFLWVAYAKYHFQKLLGKIVVLVTVVINSISAFWNDLLSWKKKKKTTNFEDSVIDVG